MNTARHSQLSTLNSPFKQTEVGVIPEDWSPKTLGTFISLRRGHDLTERDRRPGEVPVMGSAGQNGFHDTALVKGPGIVLGRSGASFGQAHFCEADCWPHNTALYVTDFHGNNPRFVFYFLRSLDFSRHNSGGAQQSLNRNFIAPIPVDVPPLSEQEAIAEALSDADALIESLEQLIAKKRQIKQGAMQELLTGKKRLPGFSGEWEIKPLRELCRSIVDGTHFTPRYVEIGIPFYSVENITANDFVNTKFISEQEHNQLIKRCKPEKSDIIITRIGSIGNTKLINWDVEASIYVSLALLKVNELIDTRYLHCYSKCRQFVKDMEDRSLMNASPKKINMGDIGDVPIPVPEFLEQTAIATILSDMDAEIAALEEKLAKARRLKQGMMQELLTGKTRLVESGKLKVESEK